MIHPIIKNAGRLIDDARLLLDHGRSESAASLSVLAMEEIGKAFLIRIGDRDGARSHKKKQGACWTLIFASHLIKEIQAAGFDIIRAEELSDWQKKWAETHDGASIVAERIKDKLNSDPMPVADILRSGIGNELKKAGYYCDLDTKFEGAFDRFEPAEIVRLAVLAFELCEAQGWADA